MTLDKANHRSQMFIRISYYSYYFHSSFISLLFVLIIKNKVVGEYPWPGCKDDVIVECLWPGCKDDKIIECLWSVWQGHVVKVFFGLGAKNNY